MNDIYEIAKQGGKHSGTYKQALKQSKQELEKGIKKYQRRIDEHKALINNPKATMKKLGKGDWDSLDPRQQKALIEKKWPSDVQRLNQQKIILQRVLTDKYGNR